MAIGGITPADMELIGSTGVWGVAVAGAIAHADDPAEAARTFVELTEKHFKAK